MVTDHMYEHGYIFILSPWLASFDIFSSLPFFPVTQSRRHSRWLVERWEIIGCVQKRKSWGPEKSTREFLSLCDQTSVFAVQSIPDVPGAPQFVAEYAYGRWPIDVMIESIGWFGWFGSSPCLSFRSERCIANGKTAVEFDNTSFGVRDSELKHGCGWMDGWS